MQIVPFLVIKKVLYLQHLFGICRLSLEAVGS